MDKPFLKDKVLLVHASFGEGHKRAATALQKSFHASCQDMLDFSPWIVKKIFSSGYITVSQRMPTFWKMIFHGTKNGRVQRGVEKLNRLLASQFLTYLRKTRPSFIVTTHFFPLYFIASIKQELPIKVIVVVTDLKAHPLWVNQCADMYCVATEDTKQSLMYYGVPAEKIVSGFVPLREGFLINLSEKDLRKKYSLDDKPCLLFMSSLRGRFPFLKQTLRSLKDHFNIFVIYGKNVRLKRYLSRLHYPSLRLFASHEAIWELFHLSSVIITKPGGLTIFEGLYKKKPFIFTHFIPGQEEENMELLDKYGIARYVTTRKEFVDAIYRFTAKEREPKSQYPLKVQDMRVALATIVPQLRISA